MIDEFEKQMLDNFGLEPTFFDRELFQWRYNFISENVQIELIYSLDKTISVSLYVKGNLTALCIGYGLEILRVDNNKIYGELNFNQAYKKLKIDPINVEFTWEDSF